MKRLLLIGGLLVLFAAEILRVYFIMPFPGSQQSNTVDFAYFLHKNIIYIRILGFVMILFAMYKSFKYWKRWQKAVFFFFILLYGGVAYLVNFKFLADKMFLQPQNKVFTSPLYDRLGTQRLVIGVTINGESKAYPIEIIGYHHQVQDSVGGEPVMVTYCTVCRTGRVFSPIVNGKKETFRLVGMDHFNAMFEDATTKSWWRQATGEAITGPAKGQQLKEIPSQQATLHSWTMNNPTTLVMRPDSVFSKYYAQLKGFDEGTLASPLEKRDSGSWQFKSWVVGVRHEGHAKAYDWNELVKKRVINDSIPGVALVITLEPDNGSFHVLDRRVNDSTTLLFAPDSNGIREINSNTLWTYSGRAIEGSLKDTKLKRIQASQEFWHSWQQFYQNTSK
jgi:hypothetical protein